MLKNKQIKSEYISIMENIINTCGFSGIWELKSLSNSQWYKLAISQKLLDQYFQKWFSVVDTSSCGVVITHYLRKHLDILVIFLCCHVIIKKMLVSFRKRNHKLPIEIGRWNGVPFNERVCHLCQKDLRDEFHYILLCEYFQRERLNYIKP